MSVINFTVEFDFFANESDNEDVGLDANVVPLVGEVIFVPLTSDNFPVLAPGFDPSPAGFKLLPFYGYLDSDGTLKDARGGNTGVRLWANDPVFNLSSLVYRVDFHLRTPAGQPVEVTSGFFEAPATDGTINLANVLQATSGVGSGGAVSDQIYASEIVDATTVGRALMKAASESAARTVLGGTATGASVFTAASVGAARSALSVQRQNAFDVRDYGATGDGVTDDTAAINSAKTAAGVGGRVVIPAGTYLVSGLTASVADQTWELHPGAVIKMKTGAAYALSISGDGVTVIGGTFDCSNGTETDWSQQGIRISGDGVTIRDTEVTDSPKMGIYALNCSRVTITGCKLTDSYDAGIFVQHDDDPGNTVEDIVITDNRVEGSGDYAGGIVVRGNSATRQVNRVTVSRNIVVIPSNPVGVVAAFSVWHSVDWVMEGNLSIGGHFGHTHVSPTRATIANNVIRGFKTYGLEIPGYVNGCTVSGNVIDPAGTSATAGIFLGANGASKDVAIVGNTITGFLGGNLIAFPSQSGVGDVVNAVISGNTLRSETSASSVFGFYATGTVTNLVFSGNTIDTASTAASTGLVFVQAGATTGVVITGNNFSNLGTRAVNLSASNGGTFDQIRFTGNILRNCPEGLAGSAAASATNLVTDSSAATANTMVLRDSQANILADAFVPSLSSTATAAGTTTLTVDSAEVQRFTGTSTQTCALPTTSVVAGQRYTVINSSTGVVTVTASGGATVATLIGGTSGVFVALQDTPTTAAHWAYNLANAVSPTSVGQAWFPAGYVSGNYYHCNSATAVATSASLGNGTVRVTPWVVTAPITITRLFAEFSVAGDADSVYRIGIWNHDSATGKPSTLLLDAGTISTGTGNAGNVATGGTPGVYEITVSQTLSPGLYWVGGAVQGVTVTQPTMRTAVATSIPIYYPISTTLPAAASATAGFALSGQTGAFGTLASAANSGSAGARIGFKVS